MKKIIWSNLDLDIDGFDFEAIGLEKENLTLDEMWEIIHDDNAWWFDCERENLNIKLSEDILAIAHLGFWNGRTYGYKEIGNNLHNVLSLERDCDYGEFYVDKYDLKSAQYHHDGSHYITYRVWKSDISEEQKENLKEKIFYNKCTKKDITRYTKSLKKNICEVYGW